MGKNYWRGDSQAVAQRTRFTVGGTAADPDTITVTVNLKEVTYTLLPADTLITAAAALSALVNSEGSPEFKEFSVEYTDGLAYFDLVAASAGVPFTATASDDTGGSGTTSLTASSITASKGPSHVDDIDNWTLGTIPTTGDSVVVQAGAAMLYGLGSITADDWEFRASYNQPIGLPLWNVLGYYEYRTRKLTLNTTTVKIGAGDGGGSPRMILGVIAASTIEIYKTGNREDANIPACDLTAAGTVTSVAVSGGDVGLQVQDESTARTFTAVSVTGDDTRLTVGRLATVTALDFDRGTVDAFGTVTAATIGRGNYTQHTGTFTAFSAYGGYIRLNHAGSTTPTCRGRGSELGPTVDCEANNLARTFPNSEFTGGAFLLDENKSVTLTGGGTHTADSTFFANSRLGPRVTWNRT